MSRHARPPAVDPKVYRHFAVTVLVVAGGVALFGNGEATGATAGENAKRPDKITRVIQADSEARIAQSRLQPKFAGSFGADSGALRPSLSSSSSDGGLPMISPSGESLGSPEDIQRLLYESRLRAGAGSP